MKAILLLRVSTEKQEIESQKEELTKLAIADKYKPKDLIYIEGVGASAIKLNEKYLAEVDELFSTIENDKSINTVYAWEISRVGRNEEMLMKIKNFLIEHRVNLIIKEPSLRLLNPDGSVNNGTELAFSLFATMSAQEFKVKKERFKRGKDRNRAEGKYCGGRIKLGYALDKNKYFIVHEENAQIIRDVFDWYLSGVSLKKINERLVNLGVIKGNKYNYPNCKMVVYILEDRTYIGERNYPLIIPEDIFNKVQQKRQEGKKEHNSKNVYFCKSILKETTTRSTMIAKGGDVVYRCKISKTKWFDVNLNVMDFIAEYSANILLAFQASKDAQTNKNDYNLKLAENKKIVRTKQSQIKEYENAITRAIEMNIQQPVYFPKEKMEAVIKKNEKQINSLKKDVADIEIENVRMQSFLSGEHQFINSIKGLSDERKKELINSVIDTIWVKNIGYLHHIITVKNKIGYIEDFIFDYQTIGRTIHLVEKSPNMDLDHTPILKNHRRFWRERNRKK